MRSLEILDCRFTYVSLSVLLNSFSLQRSRVFVTSMSKAALRKYKQWQTNEPQHLRKAQPVVEGESTRKLYYLFTWRVVYRYSRDSESFVFLSMILLIQHIALVLLQTSFLSPVPWCVWIKTTFLTHLLSYWHKYDSYFYNLHWHIRVISESGCPRSWPQNYNGAP